MSLSTSIKTDLHKRVVLVEISLIQNVGFEVVVDQWLPSRWQAEDIEAINTGEVLPIVYNASANISAISYRVASFSNRHLGLSHL